MIHISKNTKSTDLERVKKGDTISFDNGKSGEVTAVQILEHSTQKKYYYKIKNDGIVLVIK
ncbi:hypothetical protein [Pedobacter jejuensis]|uniref:Hypervirulence associated protein TUDOR domain-containing protein n=1 Tax=Pedobacter jejuensis TaxID=1268550 RepID=A0A3N0BYH5_9SPHI|nr:hypothetical protein [Pedobacter jejuensis]RNL54594.1 hypothetical protein D7004_07340 [Pedobacter jejuensis]